MKVNKKIESNINKKANFQRHFFDFLLFNIYNYNETVITMLTVKTVTKIIKLRINNVRKGYHSFSLTDSVYCIIRYA